MPVEVNRPRQIALALLSQPNDVVSRSWLRSQFPAGRTKNGGFVQRATKRRHGETCRINIETHKLQNVLRDMERAGCIVRSPESITITDRALLREIAEKGIRR